MLKAVEDPIKDYITSPRCDVPPNIMDKKKATKEKKFLEDDS